MKTRKMPLHSTRWSIAILAAGFCGILAHATPVRVDFSATLQGNGIGTLAPGSVVSGNFVFDDAQSATWSDPSHGNTYNYFAVSETIGSETVTNPFSWAQLADEKSVYNGDLVALMVNFPAQGGYFTLGGLSGLATGFHFWGSGNNIIGSEDLSSIIGLDPSAAMSASMDFYNGAAGENQGNWVGYGNVTNWQATPLPDESLTVVLLGCSFAAAAMLGRRLDPH